MPLALLCLIAAASLESLISHLRPSGSNRAAFIISHGQKESGSVLNVITVHGTDKWHFRCVHLGGLEPLLGPLRSPNPLSPLSSESEQMEPRVLGLPFSPFHSEYIL